MRDRSDPPPTDVEVRALTSQGDFCVGTHRLWTERTHPVLGRLWPSRFGGRRECGAWYVADPVDGRYYGRTIMRMESNLRSVRGWEPIE